MLAWLGCQTACFTRLGGVPATVRVDNEKTAMARGAGAWGTVNPTYRRYAGLLTLPRRCLSAAPAAAPRARSSAACAISALRSIPWPAAWPDLAELQAWTDARLDGLAGERVCPATGTSVAEAWAERGRCLTRLPETLPEPFDLVASPGGRATGSSSFEGRQYSVPFRFVGERVEVRGCAGTIQV